MDVAFNLLRACDFDCYHCFIKKEGPVLPYERIQEVVQKIKPRTVTFSGGEPLLRKDITDILKYADSQSCAINLYTNGNHIMQSLIDIMKPLDIFVYVSDHSEYGGTVETNRKVFENVRAMSNEGIKVGISKLYTRDIVPKLDDFIPKYSFVDRLVFEYPTPVGISQAEMIPATEWLQMLEVLKSKTHSSMPKVFYEQAFLPKENPHVEELRCLSGSDIFVDSNGKSYACCISVDVFEGIDEIRPVTAESSNCDNCGGGCPVLNEIYGHDPRCNDKYVPICPVSVTDGLEEKIQFPSRIVDNHESNFKH